jgi:hypothetical protein
MGDRGKIKRSGNRKGDNRRSGAGKGRRGGLNEEGGDWGLRMIKNGKEGG